VFPDGLRTEPIKFTREPLAGEAVGNQPGQPTGKPLGKPPVVTPVAAVRDAMD